MTGADAPAPDKTRRGAFPHLVDDNIRYGDTDRQGHVNNAVYATFLEFGRTQLFYEMDPPLIAKNCEPVLARIELDYLRELLWPGKVTIGTGLIKLGTSSARFAQSVFSGETCHAAAEIVIVQLDTATRRPKPWSDAQRAVMAGLTLR